MKPHARIKHRLFSKETVNDLKEQVAYSEQVRQITNRIHAAKDLDQIFVDLTGEILQLLDAERITLYALDFDKREIYSRFVDPDALGDIKEIRVPIDEGSIAGFVAKNRVIVNLTDAYDKEELTSVSPSLFFDDSWDKKTGFRTKQMLTVPALANTNLLAGVVQLINKRSEGRFTKEDEDKIQEIGRTLGIALYNQYQLAKKKPTKFDTLVSSNLITQDELNTAITEAREQQKAVESVLMAKYKIEKKEIGKSLSLFYKCPFIDNEGKSFIPPELVKNINPSYLKANFWVPMSRNGDTIEVLIDDPNSFQKIQDIKRLFPVKEIKFSVALREDILRVVNSLTTDLSPGASQDSIASIIGELASEEQDAADQSEGPLLDMNDNVIVRLAHQIIIDAYQAGASDIHIEPYSDKKDTVIRFRVDGNCYEYQKVPPSYRRALASRFKIMSRLDISERRKPQDGKIKFRYQDREIELRVATIPTQGVDNEDVVLRILASSEPIPLEKLNMSERNLQEFRQILAKPYGIILCVGPTGSGKTTTLHSALGHINDPETKIWTAEDPVEITQYGLRQVQVLPKIGFDFAAAMRSFLRADPDVIMVGEMRDHETAEIAIQASLTGHLVFSTLHTNSAVETITRLLEMGMEPFNFADALLGIVAQRLVRTLCKNCKEKYQPSKEEYDALAHGFGEEAFAKLNIPYNDHFFLYRGKGCDDCKQSGYKGRTGLHELLVATDEIKKIIQSRGTTQEIKNLAVERGMMTLLQDGILKCIDGWTDYQQVKAVALK